MLGVLLGLMLSRVISVDAAALSTVTLDCECRPLILNDDHELLLQMVPLPASQMRQMVLYIFAAFGMRIRRLGHSGGGLRFRLRRPTSGMWMRLP
jgi:hypothetical protein